MTENKTASSESSAGSPEAGAVGLPLVLDRRFKVIVFDWDGTAVMDRREDASEARRLIERLLEFGVHAVVVTGTNLTNIERQMSSAIQGHHKSNLYVCANRGSEVYGFDAGSRPVLIWGREATPKEDRLLTEIADAVRDAVVARTGLDVRVIYDRLNRRKIDLIPLPEWQDPPKSTIGDLLSAVEARLRGAGMVGGLRAVIEQAETVSRKKGLKGARVTSDVKHVEVGLTEKSHSINWVMRELVEGYHISREEVLIVGDEFGPVSGFPGSDAKMVTPHSKGAVFLSVGAEPEGVPSGIIHLGGGPARFREVLRSQVVLHERLDGRADGVWSDMPASPTRDAGWLLVDEGFNLAREHEIESLFAVSNGYVGMRAVLAERSKMSSPGTFLAGVFAIAHKSDSIPELAVAPDWMHLNIAVDGRELHLEEGEVLEHRRTLDMRQGILWRHWRHRDLAGRVTRLRFLRLASLADRHVLLQSVTLMPENYSGRVSLESIIEQPFEGPGLFSPTEANAISVSHLQNGDGSLTGPATVEMDLRTAGTGVTIAMASFSALRTEEGELIEQSVDREEGRVVGVASWEAEIGVTYCLDRVMCIHTSRDSRRPAQASARHLGRISKEGIASVVKAHVKAWESRWEASAVEVGGDDEAKRSLRFAGYHLISAANPEDERVSVGARALTGEAYKGHVFWDTEIFMLPFYIFTDPPSARGLLMYRYHTLPAARKKASALSYRGALYAWESADKGEETTPPFVLAPNGEVIRILSGEQEHHISADVAFGVWQYWEATADDSFFLVAGAEILLETARFWASRGKIEEDGCYHVRKVVGPDEYHAGVDDNAYTNLMARWNLERGAEAARILKERWPEPWQKIVERMRIASGEPAEWLRLAEAMYAGLDSKSGLLEQFQGYFGLEEIDLVPYEQRSVPMDVLLGHERIAMSKVIKQADVVMLICLLWDWFAPAVREANFRFYEPRTGHGSSLSPSIHALVAARLGDIPLAQKYFQQAAEVDLANNMGNAASGVHAAALGGLWQASVFGLAGMRLAPDGLAFDPHLLPGWSNLRFSVQWRGRRLQVAIEQESQTIEIEIGGGAALLVALSEQPAVIMAPGRRYLARHEVGGWGEWRELRAS